MTGVRERAAVGMTRAGVVTQELVVAADEHRLAATKLYAADGGEPSILHLHGLGPTASRHNVRYLLGHLAQHGHASMTFEFSGNGDSTGVLEQSCLRRRRSEALAAAAHLNAGEAPLLVGTSMGAHLAAWIVPQLRPRGLILFCPAAYPQDAADRRFDGSQARPGDYDDSPAYAGMREFDGELLIIAARDDQVVPAAAVEGYVRNAHRARSIRTVWLDGCDHFIHRWLPEQPLLRAHVHQAVLRMAGARQTPNTRSTTHAI